MGGGSWGGETGGAAAAVGKEEGNGIRVKRGGTEMGVVERSRSALVFRPMDKKSTDIPN